MVASSASGLPVEDLSSLSCHGCGSYDASLRHSAHPVVVSIILAANQRSRIGIWCARCRGLEAAKATAISLFAGWWSARGPRLTISAIRTNLAGGQQSAGTNARLLREVALFEHQRGNPEFAAAFAAAAHSVQPQRENGRLMEELRRTGHRGVVSNSPWRFAAWAPIVIAVVLAGTVAVSTFRGEDEPAESAPFKRAAFVPQQSSVVKEPVDVSGTADEIGKRLASNPDPDLARAYYRARLNEAKNEITPRVRRGDDLLSIRASILELGTRPAVADYLKKNGQNGYYDVLCAALSDATVYYRGGAPVEAIQRTAGESLNTTTVLALHEIVAELRGHEERRDALATEVDARAQSLQQMQLDLRIRGAVIALTDKALDDCLKGVGAR